MRKQVLTGVVVVALCCRACFCTCTDLSFTASGFSDQLAVCLEKSDLLADVYNTTGNEQDPRPLRTSTVFASIAAAITAVVGYVLVGLYNVRWQMYVTVLEKKFHGKRQLEEVLDRLNQRFLPSIAIDRYVFRGISKKTDMIKISFDNLGLKLKKDNRTVLHGCSGTFEAGSMVAIMGPSGCGKTSFMNTLCGKAYYGNITGDVLVNDKKDDVANYKPVTGFVPQDDVVFPKLTVREQIMYSARLRNILRGNSKQAGKGGHIFRPIRRLLNPVVDDVLNILQIGHIQSSLVGGVDEKGISGGQRKRVNIGLELAATPTLLFLDEPTSGLDSTSSLLIIRSLKRMTQMGMTIVMVIHQPRYSLFAEFDQVLLLAGGGRAVYQGPAKGATPYFQTQGFVLPDMENPADWMMDVIAGQVKSSADPEFEPAELPQRWVQAQAEGTEAARARTPDQDEVQTFDVKALAALVEEQWDVIDRDHNGTMDKEELALLLKDTSGFIPMEDDMERLATEIGGADQRIDKVEFVRYLSRRARRKGAVAEGLHLGNVPVGGSSLNDGDVALHAGLDRKVPGLIAQLWVLLCRETVEFWRNIWERVLTWAMLAFCAVAVGLLHRGKTAEPPSIVIFHLGLALMMAVSVLPTFADKPIFWRESSHGLNVLAFFMAKLAVRTISIAVFTIIYVSVYYFITWPEAEWALYMWPALLTAGAAAGWGYLVSITVPRNNATVACVILVLLLCGVLGDPPFVKDSLEAGGIGDFIVFWSIVRWTGQIFFQHYLERTGGIVMPEVPDCSGIQTEEVAKERMKDWVEEFAKAQFDTDLKSAYESKVDEDVAALIVIGQGFALVCLAALALRFMNREKQV